MNQSPKSFSRGYGEGFLSAISAGVFLVFVGAIFVTTPNLFDRIIVLLRDFGIVHAPNVGILLPAPASIGDHSMVYSAVAQFCFAWGFFQIFALGFRFIVQSRLSKKAETVSSLLFWLGAGYLIHRFLNEMTTKTAWFAFWAAIITLIGASLIVKAIILAAARQKLS